MTIVVRHQALASEGEVRQALAEFGPLRAPSLTLRWRGRVPVRMLSGEFSTEVVPAENGLVRLTCRGRLIGPLAPLMGDDARERLRGDMRHLAAAICRRAEELHASSSDGRPPPSRSREGGREPKTKTASTVRPRHVGSASAPGGQPESSDLRRAVGRALSSGVTRGERDLAGRGGCER
jgi:hypothetical protein